MCKNFMAKFTHKSVSQKNTSLKTKYLPKKLNAHSIVIAFALFLLVGFLICSLAFEIIKGESCIHKINPNIICPIFLRAHVISEIIRFVGFSNFFAGLIYKDWNKKILGISYEEIIRRQYPLYNTIFVVQLVSTLFCMECSSAGVSESAATSLFIVLLGLIYQVVVIYGIILNPIKRKKLACKTWIKLLNEYSDNDCLLKVNLFNLCKSFPDFYSNDYQEHIEFFNKHFIKYINDNRNINPKEVIEKIAEIWNEVPQMQNAKAKKRLLIDIFVQMIKDLKLQSGEYNLRSESFCVCNALNGYVVYELSQINNQQSFDEIFPDLKDRIIEFTDALTYKLGSNANCSVLINDVKSCLFTNIFLLIYMYLQYGIIKTIPPNLTKIKPNISNTTYIYGMVDLIFLSDKYDRSNIDFYLDNAKTQL